MESFPLLAGSELQAHGGRRRDTRVNLGKHPAQVRRQPSMCRSLREAKTLLCRLAHGTAIVVKGGQGGN